MSTVSDVCDMVVYKLHTGSLTDHEVMGLTLCNNPGQVFLCYVPLSPNSTI